MGSKGSQTVTNQGNQTQTYTPNPVIGNAGGQAIGMATTAAGAPFQQPVAPVAPFTPFQSIGFGETLGLQGMAQPYFNTAGNYLAGSAAPVSAADVANYYNPMAANVTAQMQNIFGQQNVQNTGNLVQSAGGVGADRVAVGQANMANQQALAAGQTYAGLYQSALQAAQQQKQMQAGAGFAFGQMGPAAQAAQQNAVNQLLGVGAQQQGLTQQELNAIYQNQLAQIAYPFQTGQYLAGITGGLAPAMGGTTTGQYYGQTTYPAPSGLAQALGLGAAGLGLMGQMGGIPGISAMGLSAAGQMPFGSAMQYLPGGSAYGATPSYQNGGYYPMFGSGPGYQEGGEVDPGYGELANREKYQEYAKIIPAAAQGNPAAETFLKDVGYDDGGWVQKLPPNLQAAASNLQNMVSNPNLQGLPPDLVQAIQRVRQQQGSMPSNPFSQFQGFSNSQSAPMAPASTPMQAPSMSQIPALPQPQAIMPNVQLPSGPMQSSPFMPASQMQGTLSPRPLGLPNFDDGGRVIPVGEVVPFNQFHNTRTLQDAIDRIDNRKQPGAQGFAGAPPEAVEQAHDAGILKIHPLHGFDDGGSVDIPVGQASPMSLTIDPTNSGLRYPGAGKVTGSPVPQTQLPQGQPGKSGPFGQFIYGLGSHSPSMPQGGGQSPMGGGLGGSLGQLGQLGGSIGKLFGGMGGGAGVGAGAGAGMDFSAATDLGLGDIGAAAAEYAPELAVALANRGGRMDTGGATTDMPPHWPRNDDPDFKDWLRQQQHEQMLDPKHHYLGPADVQPDDIRDVPMSADGGRIDDYDTIGPGMPMAPPTPLPRARPDVPKEYYPKGPWVHEFNPSPEWRQGQRRIAAGGAVDPMRPGAGYGDDDIDTMPDTLPTTETNKPTLGEMLGKTASQVGSGLSTYKRWLFDQPPPPPDKAPIVPPEAQSQYASEGHPRPAFDRPFEGTSMWDEAKGYGPERTPGFTDQHFPVPYAPGRDIVPRGDIAPPPRGGVTPLGPPGPQATPSPYTGLATMDQPYAVAASRGEPFGPTSADIPMDPFGHGMATAGPMTGTPGAMGALGQPSGQPEMAPFRRATIQQENAAGNPALVVPSRRADGTPQEALGLYGIMKANLPEWSREALGRVVSKEEFLAHPEIQTAIYDYKMGQYIKRFGIEGAGRAWLGGEGALNAPMRADPFGTRVGDYGRHFAQLVQQPGSSNAQGMITNGMRPSANVEDYRDQGPMGSAPRNVPFPNAADPNSIARRWTMSPWAALTNAGVAMATTRGPIGSVLATGIGAAGKTFAGQQQELNSEQAINDKAEQLAILADAHLRSYAHQDAALAETKRWHDQIASLRGSGQWEKIHNDMRNEAAWVGRLGSTDPADVQAVDEEIASRILKGGGQQAQQAEPDPGEGNRVKGHVYIGPTGKPQPWNG